MGTSEGEESRFHAQTAVLLSNGPEISRYARNDMF